MHSNMHLGLGFKNLPVINKNLESSLPKSAGRARVDHENNILLRA